MAEVIARGRAVELGWDRVDVRSAGVAAFDGSPPSGGAVRVAAAHGLDLTGHSATQLTREAAATADLILTMSSSHLMSVIELGCGEHAAMLASYAGGVDQGLASGPIGDPVGGPDEEYEETFELLEELIGRVMERIEPAVAP